MQRLLPVAPPGLAREVGEVAVHANTPDAELLTLTNRLLMLVPKPSEEGQRELERGLGLLIPALRQSVGLVLPWSRARSARHFIARKGPGLYGRAFLSLKEDPLSSKDHQVSMFLKAEKWVLMPGEPLKPARAIQFRGPRYNIELGRYLLPLEELLWSNLGHGGVRIRDQVWLHSSKGLTPNARARQVRALWDRYPGARALCLDHSRFDAHLSEEVLRMEHRVYTGLLGGARLLRWLLAAQCRTKGSTKHGRKYRTSGGRCSGDVNTALGNTIVSGLVLIAASHDISELSILVEGDDGVVFGPGPVIQHLGQVLAGRVLAYGFELKISEARTLGEIDYCSGRVIVGEGDPRWVRAWPKPFTTDPWTARPVQGAKARTAKAYTMAVSAWVQYRGVPVYQAWGEWLMSHVPPGKFDPWYDRDLTVRLAPLLSQLAQEDHRGEGADGPPSPNAPGAEMLWGRDGEGRELGITPSLRADFADATGVGMGDQLGLEAELASSKGPWPDHPLVGTQWKWAFELTEAGGRVSQGQPG